MYGRAIAWLLAISASFLATACEESDTHNTELEDLTFADLHQVLVDSGKVLHAEYEVEGESNQTPTYSVWYWARQGVSRYEYARDSGQEPESTIITRERQVHYSRRDNDLSTIEYPASVARETIPPAAGPLWSYFSTSGIANPSVATTEQNHGLVTEADRRLLHLSARSEALQDGHERLRGTIYTFDVYFDPATLLPVRAEARAEAPGQAPNGARITRFTRTDLVERSSLPADYFDPASLAAQEVTLDEAIELAAGAGFAIFWLGREVAAQWTSPQGKRFTAATLLEVNAPGVSTATPADSAALSYGMPPDFGSTMLMLNQQPVAAAREPRSLALIRAAGNVFPLAGFDGYVFAEYSNRGSCSFAAAQTDPSCRMFPDPVWGAVVVIDGTSITITTGRLAERDGGMNVGAFPTRESIERLIPQLRPIGR